MGEVPLGERPFDIITFDCYGTLIDWETGISEAILSAGQDDGHAFGREKVLSILASRGFKLDTIYKYINNW